MVSRLVPSVSSSIALLVLTDCGGNALPPTQDNCRANALQLSVKIFASGFCWGGSARAGHPDPLVEIAEPGREPAGGAPAVDVQAPLALGKVDRPVLLDH